jgi:phosphatidylinositol phospholipase C, gamma-2
LQATFANLFELVEYFKREPLRTVDYQVLLREPVPQPAPHEDKKWFHRNLTRGEAEDWLRRIPQDGAFLVRGSESVENYYAISFRYGARCAAGLC